MRKYSSLFIFFFLSACANSQAPVKNMINYDLTKPQVFTMPQELREISGFVFLPGNNDLVFAEQDEEGKVYYFKLGDKKISHTKFGTKGDFEDISIFNNHVFMLRSDGVLSSFPVSQVRTGNITDVKTWKDVLPKGEYEGMFADQQSRSLYVLCKHCSGVKTGGGFIFTIKNDGSIVSAGDFRFDTGEKFHPSAIAKNTASGEWYILSSVNSMLVVADKNWQVKDKYPLDRSIFNQPEGIAFDSFNNLYISNEGGQASGNILKFAYRKSH